MISIRMLTGSRPAGAPRRLAGAISARHTGASTEDAAIAIQAKNRHNEQRVSAQERCAVRGAHGAGRRRAACCGCRGERRAHRRRMLRAMWPTMHSKPPLRGRPARAEKISRGTVVMPAITRVEAEQYSAEACDNDDSEVCRAAHGVLLYVALGARGCLLGIHKTSYCSVAAMS
jgi:hypothetical protein